MRKYAVGIDVGASKINIALFGDEMKKIRTMAMATDVEWTAEELVAVLTHQVEHMIAQAGIGKNEIRGVGAAFPSFIDYKSGVVIETSFMRQICDKPLRSMLSKALDLPVWIDNDANVAGLAEYRMGAGRGHDDMIYVTISSGIGGALILNGKLYRGMHGMAGEIGHMFISDSQGYPDTCGVTGCVQSISSGFFMARYAIDRILEGEESAILDYAGTLASVDMIAVNRAVQAGDKLALEVIDRGAEYLGRMFHSLTQIFDINVFVYGGGVSKLGDRFIGRIIETYRGSTCMDTRYPAQFLPAQLGDNAGTLGAALLVENN